MREIPDALRSMQRFVADTLLADNPNWEVALVAEGGTFARPFALVGLASPTQFPSGSKHTAEHIQPMAINVYMPVDAEKRADVHLLEALRIEALLARVVRYQGGGRIAVPADFAVVPTLGDGALSAATRRYEITAQGRAGSTPSLGSVDVVTPADASVALTWPALFGASRYGVWRGGQLIGYARPSGDLAEGFVDTGDLTPNPNAVMPLADTARVGAPLRIPLYDYEDLPLSRSATVRGLSDFMKVTDLSIGRRVEEQDERRITITVDIRVTWAHAAEWPDSSTALQGVAARAADLA